MAHLIFIARNRDLSSFLLTGPAVLGRSVECDIYAPDIFVSREHCRFEKTPDGWVVIDQRSRNGIYFNGRRFYRRVMKHGDLLEVGSFSVRFQSGDIPAALSTMTPFGEGTSVASLMDTLFAGGLRPAEYIRKSQRKPAWVRAREEAEAAALRLQQEAEEQLRLAAEKLNFCDGCELDIEMQITASAEALAPQYVLVSRDIAARFEDLMGETSAGTARVGISAGESISAVPVDAPPAASEAAVARAGAVAAVAGVGGGGNASGARGPTGAMKSLFEDVYKDVEKPGKAGKKDKKAEREEAKAAKEAERIKKREEAKARPDVAEYSMSMGERLKSWYAWGKTIDISLASILTGIKTYPKQVGLAASILILLAGGWGLKAALTPKYHKPVTSGWTAEQRARYEAAAKEN